MRTSRLLVLLCLLGFATAQEAPPNGPRRIDPAWHALTGATVHVAPGRTIEKATVTLRGDRIIGVSTTKPPAGARVWDCSGLHVYAGLIDPFVEVEPPAHKSRHWNTAVTPERLVRASDNATAEELRKLGFTAAAVAPRGGIVRGRASIVALTPHDSDLSVRRPTIYRLGVYESVGLGRNRGGYPGSLMGTIALIRQTLHDGLAKGTLYFDASDELDALRAGKIAREFRRTAVIVGSGTEFRRLEAIRDDGFPLIIPLNFPRTPEVSSVGNQESTDLRTLMTWEQAPTNPRRLDAAGLTVALTTSKLRRRSDFFGNLRKAIGQGLPEARALAMLTVNPARILGVAEQMGTVEPAKVANLVVTDKPLFERGMKVRDVWIDGRRFEITPPPGPDFRGEWTVDVTPPPEEAVTVKVGKRNAVTVQTGEKKTKAKRVKVSGSRISFTVEQTAFGEKGVVTVSGTIHGDEIVGHGINAAGQRFAWNARRTKKPEEEKREAKETKTELAPDLPGYPFGPYALAKPPAQPDLVVVRGATIWTCGDKGIVKNGQLEVRNGKITYVGPSREVAGGDGTVWIDGTGRHVTPGLIDCHSHTGISRGVNEGGQAVTAEVRIGDVTNPDSIGWYRQLAGGLTAANSLHGSANPIGGQNQVNKLRWGAPHPDRMHFEGAIEGIKFALGENVKRSNGRNAQTRYPSSRMGVEALIRDRFTAAREYIKSHDRVDLELEALGEILQGKRLIHCHSYRQDEILMLCRLAKEFGFKIGTFQHVLEGYKVAEAVKEQAIGASSFSDWWNYKVEVQDAIPYNGALMHAVGVNVTFNSDSGDLARRMNLEAAKAVKYGDVPPAEALKFVTLNAAIQLKIDDRVGSLEPGKDADFAIWSHAPLSVYTKCTETWIDGRRYFSLEEDKKHRATIAKERQRLIQKVLGSKQDRGEEGKEREGAEPVGPRRMQWILDRLRSGGDPMDSRPGECGCFEVHDFEEGDR